MSLDGAHWRNTARDVKFFKFDARAAAPLMLVIIHMRLWTLITAIIVLLIFVVLERFGLTVNLALRRLRTWIIGPYRPAKVKAMRRDFIDRGSI